MTSFNAFQHDGYGGFRSKGFNARNGGRYLYAVDNASGISDLFKISPGSGSIVASVEITDFIATTVAVNADGTRIAIGAFGGADGDDTVKVFGSDLVEIWGVSLPAINTSSGGRDIAFMSNNDVVFGTTKAGTLSNQNTLYRLDADDGSTTWEKRFPDNALAASTLVFNAVATIAIDESDNVYVLGDSNSPGDTNNLAKFNSGGTQQWIKSLANFNPGLVYSPTPYLFSSSTNSTDVDRRSSADGTIGTTGTLTSSGVGHHDGVGAIFVGGATASKYTESFTQEWSTTLDNPAQAVTTDAAGNSYWIHALTGDARNMTKLDPDGDEVWSVGIEGGVLADVAM